MSFLSLETQRLILRAPQAEDFEGWAAFHCDAECMRYLGGPISRADAWRSMAAVTGMWVLQGFSEFSVIEKATGSWIGRAGPWFPEGWPGPEVGWMFLKSARGKGYAAEAATASLDLAFGDLGWERVIHVIDPENRPSQRLAQRMGSVLIGPVTLPGSRKDWPVEAWGQTRDQWRARRAAGGAIWVTPASSR